MIVTDFQDRKRRHSTWPKSNQPLTLLMLCFCLACVLIGTYFSSTLMAMIQKWQTSGTYAHGFMILPVVVYLVFLKRDTLQTLPVRPSGLAVLPMLGVATLWHIGSLGHVLIIQQFCVISMIVCSVYLFWGKDIFKALLFPLAYLYFMIPFGHFLIAPLQDITAYLTVTGLNWTGIPVFMEGWQLTTTRGEFEVAEACSGIRYVIASVALGALYAYFAYRTWWRQLIFIALCVLVPILANGIRAYGIVLIAHLTHMKWAVGVDHLIYGWIFFGLTMALMFWLGRFFQESGHANHHRQTDPSQAVGLQSHPMKSVILLIILCAFIAGLQRYFDEVNRMVLAPQQTIHFTPLQWQPMTQVSQEEDWQPFFQGASQSELVHFLDENHRAIDLFYARYFEEQQGKELISATNRLFDNDNWHLAKKQKRQINFQNKNFVCMEYDLFNRYGRRLVWSWYRVNQVDTPYPIVTKLLILYHKIRGNLEPPMVIAMSIPYQYYPEQARHKLDHFAASMTVAQHDKPIDSNEQKPNSKG